MERGQPRPRSTKRVNVRIKGPMVPPIGLTLRSHVPHATAAEHVRHEVETQAGPRAESAEETTEGAATNLERNPGLVLSQLRRRPRALQRTWNASRASCLKLRAHSCPRATLPRSTHATQHSRHARHLACAYDGARTPGRILSVRALIVG